MADGAADDIWHAMKTELVGGVPVFALVGDSDPKEEGERSTALIESVVPIASDAAILDIGCGCGRVALVLADKIGANGRYLGIDIVPPLIGFATRHITPAFPNFEFRVRRQDNLHYDYMRTADADAVEIAAPPTNAFDLAIAFSLFTHLDVHDATQVLHEAATALKSRGRLFATFFILTKDAEARMRPGSRFHFEHASPDGGALVERAEDPLYAVAFTPEQLQALLDETGFFIEANLPGAWTGAPDCRTYQDALLLRKKHWIMRALHDFQVWTSRSAVSMSGAKSGN